MGSYKRFPVGVWDLFENLLKSRLTGIRAKLAELELNMRQVPAADHADSLTSTHYIDGISFNGTDDVVHYGTCNTAADVASKVVVCSNFHLSTGAKIAIRFDNANTADPEETTININATGAMPLKYRGEPLYAEGYVEDGILEVVYTGAGYYEVVGSLGKVYLPFIPATYEAAGLPGLVPAPARANESGTYLESNGTWSVPQNTTYTIFQAATHLSAGLPGLVPAPAAGDDATKFLNATGAWEVPPDTTYNTFVAATESVDGGRGLVPAPIAGDGSDKYLNATGRWTTPPNDNTTYDVFIGATEFDNGGIGLVPSAAAGDNEKFLAGDGTWKTVAGSDTTYDVFHASIAADPENSIEAADAYDGLVPAPDEADSTKFLAADGTWRSFIDNDTTYLVFNPATESVAGTSGLVPAPAIGDGANKFLNAEGNWVIPIDEDTTYTVFDGADSLEAGTTGLVPAPAAGDEGKFLAGDGTWKTPVDLDTTYLTFTAADEQNSVEGYNGLVPAPSAPGSQVFLAADGTWKEVEVTDTTYTTFHASIAADPENSIEAADAYDGLVPAPDVVGSNDFLAADGTWKTVAITDTTYNIFAAADEDSSIEGYNGLVPAPDEADNTKFLAADGTWLSPFDNNEVYTTFTAATSLLAGEDGLVPGPAINTDGKYFLNAQGSWAVPPDVTSVQAGYMTPELYNTLKNIVYSTNTQYSVGERVYSSDLPSNYVLECVTAGTTGSDGISV